MCLVGDLFVVLVCRFLLSFGLRADCVLGICFLGLGLDVGFAVLGLLFCDTSMLEVDRLYVV